MKKKNSWIFLIPATAMIVFAVRAGELQQATVTRIQNQVEIVPPNTKPEPAAIGNTVHGNTGIQTGAKSLAELTFSDQTLARLGANTTFSFEGGTRSVDLQDGTILLQVPKHAGGAKIKTAPVTAAITGTTVLLEYTRGKNGQRGVIKMIVIEGTVRLGLNSRLGENIVVNAGQEITLSDNAKSLPQPQDVDVSRIMKTSRLINAGPLGNKREITDEIAAQQILKQKGILVTVDFGPHTQEAARMPNQIQNAVQNQRNVINSMPTPPPTPPPTPAPTPLPMPTPIPTPNTNR